MASFVIGRVTVEGTVNGGEEVEVKLGLKSLTLADIRPHSNLAVKK